MHMILLYIIALFHQYWYLILPQCCSVEDPLSKKTETAKDVAHLLKEFASFSVLALFRFLALF